jgi:hypothetical protein
VDHRTEEEMNEINLRQTVPVLRKTQACEACGGPFTCEIASAKGCWCGEVKLSEDTLLELRTKYGNCVCRTCLEKLAKKEHPAAESEQ